MHPSQTPPFPRSTGDFARTVQGGTSRSERLQRGVELVVELVEGCNHAGVTLASRQAVHTAAASDDIVRQGDAWQYELGEGPCLDTVRDQHTVISQDLRSDNRWSRWATKVVDDLGVNAMMSLLLYTDKQTLGALNLYADQSRAWNGEQIAIAHSLAGHLAAALADAVEIEGRGQAMVNRTVIGQAEGILMERFQLNADRAFEFLRRVSQQSNRKLVSVAEELVTTRRLPDERPPAD